jgi:hypothetical protein
MSTPEVRAKQRTTVGLSALPQPSGFPLPPNIERGSAGDESKARTTGSPTKSTNLSTKATGTAVALSVVVESVGGLERPN